MRFIAKNIASLISMPFFLLSFQAKAELPNLVGNWSGSYIGTYSTCTGTNDTVVGDQITVTQSITVAQQDGDIITGDFSIASSDFSASQFSFTAQVDDSGRFVAFTSDSGDVEVYQFNFGSNEVTYNGGVEKTTLDTSGNPTGTCNLTAPQTTLTGTAIPQFIVAAVNSSSINSAEVVNNAAVLQSNVFGITRSILTRANRALYGAEGGLRRHGSGINLFYEEETGKAAGSGYDSLSAWGGYTRTEMDNSGTLTSFDGHRNNMQGGVDFSPMDKLIVGVSFGQENTSIDTDFNNGDYNTNGFTLAPYAAYLINNNSNIDLVVGHTSIEVDQSRLSAAGAAISSDIDVDRWFASGNLNLFKQIARWDLGADVGFIWAKELQDSYTETDGTRTGSRDIEIAQVTAGANVAYMINNYFQPYGRISYFRNITSDDSSDSFSSNDNDDSVVTAGIRFYSDVGVTGNFEWMKRIGQSDLNEDVYSFNIYVDL